MKSFNRLMMEFRSVIMEVETRLKVLNAEFSEAYNRNPFEAIKSRLKSPESIYEKLERRGFPVTVESIRENLTDVFEIGRGPMATACGRTGRMVMEVQGICR